MEETGYQTIELAKDSEVNKETISLWRGGKQKSYTYEKVARVASRLGTTAEDLLELQPEVPQPEAAAVEACPVGSDPEASQRELVRRVAALFPMLEELAELEEVVAEARRLAEEPPDPD